jgi:NAD(P)-dependent dehydrogenase (short-subunit alcohol dehydrogenase family)
VLETSPRSVVVTGGGTGIGRAIAAAFADQGDQVTITGRRAAPLKEAAAPLGAAWVAFDASDRQRSPRSWTSCHRPWPSRSTTRAGTPTSTGRPRTRTTWPD